MKAVAFSPSLPGVTPFPWRQGGSLTAGPAGSSYLLSVSLPGLTVVLCVSSVIPEGPQLWSSLMKGLVEERAEQPAC